MSIKLMSHAWDHFQGTATEKLVLLALCDFANDEGDAWPSVATLERKTGASERSVRYTLRHLESLRWIIRTTNGVGGKSLSTHYRIIKGATIAPGAKPAPLQRGQPLPQRGQPLPVKGAPVAPEPSLNRQEPSGGQADAVRPPTGRPVQPGAALDQTPVSLKNKKYQEAKNRADFFKRLGRMGLAIDRNGDRLAWEGLAIANRTKGEEMIQALGVSIDLFRDRYSREMRFPSEARAVFEQALKTIRNKEAAA